jgi:hypothetical protein
MTTITPDTRPPARAPLVPTSRCGIHGDPTFETRRCASCDRAYRTALLDLVQTGSATVAHQAIVDARRHWETLPGSVELHQFRTDIITAAARRLP